MLTRSVRNAPQLCKVVNELAVPLSQPQRQHILHRADALWVGDETKTLAALPRQFLEAPDPSNRAAFLRISPWSADAVRPALRRRRVAWAVDQAQRLGLPQVRFLNLDDSLGENDQHTRHLEPVDWFHDHPNSPSGQPRFTNGFCYREGTLRIGTLVVTVDRRLDLRARTVRRWNRQRSPEHHRHFRSTDALARSILEARKPLLPKDWTVDVPFDRWYASEKRLQDVHRPGGQVVGALTCHRTRNGQRLDRLANALRPKRSILGTVTAADGTMTTDSVGEARGRLAQVPLAVRVDFSQRHPKAKASASFLSPDLTRTPRQALQGSRGRWSWEVVNFSLKTQLGLADVRVRSYEAVETYLVVVPLAWASGERRLETERSAPIKTSGDRIRRHRNEPAPAWLTEALQMALSTGAMEPVFERFLRPPG